MFEETKSFSNTQDAGRAGVAPAAQVPQFAPADPFGSEPAELRELDWSELTARLSAARDFRRVLQREADRKFANQSGGFADAAARYFRAKDNNEQGVNLVALEQSKGSSCMNDPRTLDQAAEATREKQ